MATVVQQAKDTRFEDLGEGVGLFLTRMKKNRIDKLQQELMDNIAKAPDEASAAALYGDSRFQDVVTDPERMAVLDRYMASAQPGQETIFGYNEEGTMVPFSVKKGTPIDQTTYDSRGLRITPDQVFFASDSKKIEEIPVNVGAFQTRNEALNFAQKKFGEDTELRIYTAAEAQLQAQLAQAVATGRRSEATLGLTERQVKLAESKPFDVLADVREDYKKGFYGPVGSSEAIKLLNDRITRINHLGFGRLPSDIAAASAGPLSQQGAFVHNLSRRSVEIINLMEENGPDILSSTAGPVVRALDAIGDEFRSMGELVGIAKRDINEYDFGSFRASSTTFKNLLVDFAIANAAAQGFTGRSLSNEDFQRFLGLSGTDINDPATFITNMVTRVNDVQEDFRTTWRTMQPDSPSWEAVNGAFPTFDLAGKLSKDKKAVTIKSLQDWADKNNIVLEFSGNNGGPK